MWALLGIVSGALIIGFLGDRGFLGFILGVLVGLSLGILP